MTFGYRILTSSAAALTIVAAPAAALAQTGGPSSLQAQNAQLEEVVVTAQKREQRMQDVPISVAAFSAEMLERTGVVTTADLPARVAGFIAQERTGSFVPYLRGVGSVDPNPANESIVSTYVDGVYIVSMPAGLLALSNIERIEVLKGPQGTLFGRNSVGGVINIITKTPTSTPQANVEVGYGNYGTAEAKGYLSGGLTSTLSADVAVAYQHQNDGWGTNVDTGKDVGYVNYDSARGKLFLDLGDTTATLSADYTRTETDASVIFSPYSKNQVLADGRAFPGGFYDAGGTDPAYDNVDQTGGSLRLAHDFGFANLLSISAYRYSKQVYTVDQDDTPLRLIAARQDMKTNDYTQELQLTSSKGSPIDWIAGTFYLHHDVNPVLLIRQGTASTLTDYHQITESLAGYAQATAPLFARTNFTAGVRYTSDDQSFKRKINGAPASFPSGNQRFNKVTWRLALDHKLNDDVMAYASYNRGFKSGLWNITVAQPTTTEPEVLDAYEVGLKSDLFERTVRLNLAAFDYEYDNMQYNIVFNGVAQVKNAASSKIQGLDFDGSTVLARGLRLDFGGVWSWKRDYTSFPSGVVFVPQGTVGTAPTCTTPLCAFNGSFTDNTILLAPEWSLNGSLDYSVPTSIGEWAFDVSASYSSRFYRTIDNRLSESGYTVANASLKWTAPDDHLSVTAWVKNLTATEYHTFGAAISFGYVGGPAPPRTYGLRLGYQF